MSFPQKIHGNHYLGFPIWNNINGDAGCRKDIIDRGISLLDSMLNVTSKVMFLRFDLRFPKGYSSICFRNVLSDFTQRLTNHYNNNIYSKWIWCREQKSTAKNPHYHCILFLDAQETQDKENHFCIIEQLWSKTLGFTVVYPGIVERCDRETTSNIRRNGFMITQNDKSSYAEAVRWLSYLAKSKDKGNAPLNTHEWGSSSIKPFGF